MPKPSRGKYSPNDQDRLVAAALASFGHPQAEIAKYLGIDQKTLRKYYRQDLDTAMTKRNMKVFEYLYRLASGQATQDENNPASHKECCTAAIFWAKTRGQWTEKAQEKQAADEITGLLMDAMKAAAGKKK